MADKYFYSGRFDSIQAMRGIAAFSVILHHITWINNGAFGVDIFFCISGFIMMYVTEQSSDRFLAKRFVRIIPLYYCITILTFTSLLIMPGVFEKTTADWTYLVKALLFIPYSINDVVQPLVRVGWTLNYEMFFYIILWASMLISRKNRAVISSGIIICIVILGKVFSFDNDALSFWTDSIMIEFIFGIISYEILRRGAASAAEGRKYLRILFLLVAAACYIFMWQGRYADIFDGADRYLVQGIPAFVLFLSVFIAGYKIKIPKPLVFFGNISYSIYLIHYFTIRLYDHFLCPDGKADAIAVIGAIGAVAAVTVMGAISYYLFEEKLNRFLRKRLGF